MKNVKAVLVNIFGGIARCYDNCHRADRGFPGSRDLTCPWLCVWKGRRWRKDVRLLAESDVDVISCGESFRRSRKSGCRSRRERVRNEMQGKREI